MRKKYAASQPEFSRRLEITCFLSSVFYFLRLGIRNQKSHFLPERLGNDFFSRIRNFKPKLILGTIAVVVVGFAATIRPQGFYNHQSALGSHQVTFFAMMPGRLINIITSWYGFGKFYVLCHFLLQSFLTPLPTAINI